MAGITDLTFEQRAEAREKAAEAREMRKDVEAMMALIKRPMLDAERAKIRHMLEGAPINQRMKYVKAANGRSRAVS